MFSPNSNRRTYPRFQHAALSHGGASSQFLPSGGTAESRRGGNNTNAAPTPAPPAGRSPQPAKRAKMTTNVTVGKGSSLDDADDGGDKYDDEDDIIQDTDGTMVVTDRDIAADLIFAEKAAEPFDNDDESQTASDQNDPIGYDSDSNLSTYTNANTYVENSFSYMYRKRSNEPIRLGDVIEYYSPIGVTGDKSWLCQATVVAVDPEKSNMPLVLDNGDGIPSTTSVKRIRIMKNNILVDHPGIFRSIDRFKMKKQGETTTGDVMTIRAAYAKGRITHHLKQGIEKCSNDGGLAIEDILHKKLLSPNKDVKSADIIPATDGTMVVTDRDIAADLLIAEKKAAELVDKHRQVFMKRAFSVRSHAPDDPLTTVSARIKMCRPQEDLDKIISILENWRVGVNIKNKDHCPERDSILKFRKANTNGAKYAKQYVLDYIQIPGSDTLRTVLRRKESNAIGRIVVSREEVFDCIDKVHKDNGHMGQERTWMYCKDTYWNIAQALVKHYCLTCPTCMKKKPITQPAKGSRKPIRSRRYRDRFQIDFIDFRKLRKRDPFGVLMRWVMTIEDHATGLTYLCALPRKRPHLIAYKLQEIFGVIGFPKIFHTANGKEITAKVVLKALREMNPNIFTVTGRRRRPSDQGSDESMDKLVKRILGTLITERRLVGDNPNWTEVLGMVSATINSQHCRGKDDVSSFEAVYGQVLNHDMSCSKAEARECWTLPQFLKLTNDAEFAEYAAKNYIVDEDSSDAAEQEDSSGYFSDEELQDDEKEEVTDDDFFNLLNQNILETDTARKLPPEEQHLNLEKGNDFENTVGLLHDQGGEAHDGDADGDHSQTFDVDEDHDTYLRGEETLEATTVLVAHEAAIQQTIRAREHSTFTVQQAWDHGTMAVEGALPEAMVVNTHPNAPALNQTPTCQLTFDSPPAVNNDIGEQQTFRATEHSIFTVQQAWDHGNIARLFKPLGSRGEFKFLWPSLICGECTFVDGAKPFIQIGDEQYLASITNTTNWYDGVFISSFAQLAAHYAHITADERPSLPSGVQLPLLIHITYPMESLQAGQYKPLRQGITRVVAVLHDKDHYGVLEIDVTQKTVLIYDGLYRDLDRWVDYVFSALKRCMLCDLQTPHLYVADEAQLMTLGRSRVPTMSIEGYQLTLGRDDDGWRFERGHFVKQTDPYNCGPIACTKILEMFCLTTVEEVNLSYRINAIRTLVTEHWRKFIQRSEQDLIVRVRERLPLRLFSSTTRVGDPVIAAAAGASAQAEIDPHKLCFCYCDSPDMELVRMECCKQTIHRQCFVAYLCINSQCVFCRADVDMARVLELPTIDRSDVISPATMSPTQQTPTTKKRDLQEMIVQAVSPCRKSKCGCNGGKCKVGRCGCIKKGFKCSSACLCNGNCAANPNNGK